jgi:phosphotransferase system enzyme I (PtsI)
MVLRGIAVSSGIARGRAHVLLTRHDLPVRRREIAEAEIAAEVDRFESALVQAERDLVSLQQSLAGQIGPREAEIFGAQALLVRDSHLRDPVRALVREKRINVEAALAEVLERLVLTFEAVSDAYIRERGADIRDVGRRILGLLVAGPQRDEHALVPEHAIVVAEELLPSLTARLEMRRVAAFVSERGGKSSHASILARAQGVAAVAGVEKVTSQIKTGDELIVDGIAGVVYVNPDQTVQVEYERLERDMRARKKELHHLVPLPSVTACGTPIPLLANASKVADTELAVKHNAEGIGLYRTEFGFAVRGAFPTDLEQYEFLSRAAERIHPRPVTFRLLDLGGDKELPYFPLPAAHNPSLSQRGTRLLLEHPQILKSQLRAFLRVSADHPVSILMPIIGGVEEVRRTRAILREVQGEMEREGLRFNPETPLGAMIEVPAAALLARALAREVDFFSLGTNDLVQYVMAVDREDERVARYYQPLHPGVLRLIRWVADSAHEAGRELTMCGEMAGNAAATPLLLGLGVRRFSVAPGQMLEVKSVIRQTRLDEAEQLAERALEMACAAEVEGLLASLKAEPSPTPIAAGA